MNKEHFEYNITEDNASHFAVVPAGDLKRLRDYVEMLRSQISFLDKQLDAMGVGSWEMHVKTVADIEVKKGAK
jgi:hypothetical protein